MLLVGTTNGSIMAVGIFSSSEVSVALRTSAAAVLVRGHMGDVNNVACDSDKQVLYMCCRFMLYYGSGARCSFSYLAIRWCTRARMTVSSDAGTWRPSNVPHPCSHQRINKPFPLIVLAQASSARTSWIPSCASISLPATTALPLATAAAPSAAGKRAQTPAARWKTWCWRPSTPPGKRILLSSSSAPAAAVSLWATTRMSSTCTLLAAACIDFAAAAISALTIAAAAPVRLPAPQPHPPCAATTRRRRLPCPPLGPPPP